MRNKWIALFALLLVMTAMAAPVLADCSVTGCSLGSWITLRSATCRREGYERQYCRNCDHYEWRNLPKLPHTPGEWTIDREPTCTRVGSRSSNCTECGDPIRRNIDMVPHEYGAMAVAKEPTCTQDGRGEEVCAVCGRVRRSTIDALGHDYVNNAVIKEPTCTAKGKAQASCTRCGREREISLDKLPHSYGEWTVLREPNGKTPGRRESVCAVCGKSVKENFFPEGTLYQDMEKNPAVIDMQLKLTDLGYYFGGAKTGTFGANTAKAVARFQRDNGLEETGVAYPQTLEKLAEVWVQKGFGQ